jgi:hypothetical protein
MSTLPLKDWQIITAAAGKHLYDSVGPGGEITHIMLWEAVEHGFWNYPKATPLQKSNLYQTMKERLDEMVKQQAAARGGVK